MKMKTIVSLLLTLALMLGLLAGCGAVSKSTGMVTNTMDYAAEAPEAAAGALEAGNADTSGALSAPEGRKWIVTMEISAETEDLDALLTGLNEQIAGLKGYVEDQNVYNGSNYSSRRYRRSSLTIRIPAEDVDGFTQALSGLANVVSTSKSLEDVTLQYTDTESHLAALETEQQRLLELMESAETMADLLEIESRLTEVRYSLERYGSQLRLYDNQIDYATIYLDIEEVQEYTPVEEPGLWQRISGGFVDSIRGLGEGLLDLLVWLIVNSPYLLVYGGVAVAVLVVLRKVLRRRSGKKQQEDPKKEQT